jgi:gamma-glutamyltranspeptidase
MYGWLAAGVPGILAGLELAQKTYGTKKLAEVMQPAIGLAREGFPFGGAAAGLKASVKQLAADPGSQKLYFREGKPLEAKDHYANPDAARMLEQFARDNSVEAFYRGDVAERIAAAFAANGGLVTKADLAAYQAKIVEPNKIGWGDWTLHTAPLTAGGVTTLHALLLLEQLKWAEREPLADTLQMQVEAFRYAWQDRLELFGDPEKVDVPLARLPLPDRPAVSEIVRGYASLVDTQARAAFVHTARSVIDLAGQRVDARDRLYLATSLPTMVVWGGRDSFIPVAHAAHFAALVPTARVEVFERAGHFPHVDEPRRFARTLLDFVTTTEPARLDAADFRDRLAAGL